MRPTLRALCLLLLVAGTVACAQTFDATTLGVDASMASPAASAPSGESFRINRKAVFLLWGLVPASTPSLDKALAGQVTGTAKVTDLKIRVRSRWSDVFFTVITGGLVVPRSVTYEGLIVKP